MCGRFTQHWTWAQLRAVSEPFWSVPDLGEDPRPRYNIAPTQAAWVIRATTDEPGVDQVRWGFANPHRPGEVINARIETARRLPMFRDSAKARRCLVPADAFYEWEPKGDGPKQPWALAARDGLFLLAGLWEPSDEGDRFVTLTCDTPPGFEPAIHHRMPCVVRPEDGAAWLDPANTEALPLALPFGDPEALSTRAWPISTRVNTPRNDDPRLLERVEPEAGLFG